VTVGLVGATGGVGRAVVRRLHAAGAGPLRVGGRRADLAERLVAEALGGRGEAVAVDAADAASLDRFCAGCRLVVSCAGPASELGDTVALAAWRAGADVVDASEVPGGRLAGEGRVAVLSAGLTPGLSGILPRCLADGFDRPERLTAHAGGLGRLTPAAAADYLAGAADGAGGPLAAWRNGRRVARALLPLRDVELPPFPGRVTAQPYLSAELEGVARALGLEEAAWYTVFDGLHLPAALARLQGSPDARQLVLASELDCFGREPYQLMVLEMAGIAAGEPACRTLLLRAGDGIELTGVVAALAALAVLAGEVRPGVHQASEALPAAWWWERLRCLPEVQALQVVVGPAAEAAVEEGEL
jgi:Saccharopine dehydrogenase NADP binding domain